MACFIPEAVGRSSSTSWLLSLHPVAPANFLACSPFLDSAIGMTFSCAVNQLKTTYRGLENVANVIVLSTYRSNKRYHNMFEPYLGLHWPTFLVPTRLWKSCHWPMDDWSYVFRSYIFSSQPGLNYPIGTRDWRGPNRAGLDRGIEMN